MYQLLLGAGRLLYNSARGASQELVFLRRCPERFSNSSLHLVERPAVLFLQVLSTHAVS